MQCQVTMIDNQTKQMF